MAGVDPKNAEAPLPSEASTGEAANSDLSAPNGSRPTGHSHRGLFHGLNVTDETLFNRALSITEKLVLGATAAHPTRDPSQRYLATFVPGAKKDHQRAQNRLEGIFGLIVYDRPRGRERDPASKRYRRSNRALLLAPSVEPLAPQNEHRRVWLPSQVVSKLPKGQRNSGVIVLLALFYAREQLRRGAIHVDDASAAALLQLSEKQARRAREALVKANVLVRAKKAPGSFIYTMPGATARPAKPADLDVARTRTLRMAPVDLGDPVTIYANAAEWEMLNARFSKLPQAWRSIALTHAYESLPPYAMIEGFELRPILGSGVPLTVQAAIDGIENALRELSSQRTDTARSDPVSDAVQTPERSSTSHHEIEKLAASGRDVSEGSDSRLECDLRFSSSEQAVSAIIEAVRPALAVVFGPILAEKGRKAEKILRRGTTLLARRLELRSGAQAKLIADEIRRQLATIDPSNRLGQKYAMLTTRASWLVSNDDIYFQVKQARPKPRGDILALLEAESRADESL